ncbi:uncharacterized protein LOC110936373 [Helianthus annuus]|uniref:uncharacterized protein LOC110936373 n=1 Tax=Helianthus annuus TaxID=4232 RepID=UPI000B8FFDCC|nr:uncharacterized protein LOC110936373 [Helianthus annuus]
MVEKKFKKLQEGTRKDVEHGFGVLKGKWGILRRPMQTTNVYRIRSMTYACMILYNMIFKDDGHAFSPVHTKDPLVQPVLDNDAIGEIMDPYTHFRFDIDLVTHIAI